MTSHDSTPVPDYRGLLGLEGKGFLVFGAGRGIGRQTAHALSQFGARVACIGRGREATEAVAEETGGIACLGDATRRVDMERILEEAEAGLGGIDGLVDILGMPRGLTIENMTDEDWDWQFDIGLRHAFLAAQLAAPRMAARGGGTMVFVGSIAGIVGSLRQVGYGTAKAALHHFVRAAAVEYGPRKIRINGVVPGVCRTPRVNASLDAERWAAIESKYPMGEVGESQDIAAACLFLSTDLSRHVNGQNIVADGGLTARSPLHDVSIAGVNRNTT